MTGAAKTFVVWMHRDGEVRAVGHFVERDLADAYASYANRRLPARWFEVRSESGAGS